MRFITLVLLIINLFSIQGVSQHTAWTYHRDNHGISDILLHNDTVWIASWGFGVTSYDINTEKVDYYLKNNSGITSGYPRTIAIDSLDRKWFGFSSSQYWWEGINIFNGQSWQHLHRNYNNYPTARTNLIKFDSNNNIWISSRDGHSEIWNHNGSDWVRFDTVYEELKFREIMDLETTSDGKVFISTFDRRLCQYDIYTNAFTIYDSIIQGYKFKNIIALTIGKDETVWALTSTGIFKLIGSLWQRVANNPFGQEVSDIVVDTLNKVWVTGSTKGVAKYDSGNWEIFDSIGINVRNFSVRKLVVDKKRNHVYASGNSGLFKYDGVNWKIVDISYSENFFDYGRSIIVNNSNDVIAEGGMVTRFNGTKWTNYIRPQTNLFNSNSIYEYGATKDIQGNIWFPVNADNGGVFKFDGNSYRLINITVDSSADNKISTVGADKNGNVWAASMYGKLFKIDINSEDVTYFEDVYVGIVRYIFEDKDGNLFFGKNKYDGSNWSYMHPDTLQTEAASFYDMDQDKDGNYWFAGIETIYKYNVAEQKWSAFKVPMESGEHIHWLWSIKADINGNIWTSGWSNSGGGLYKFDGLNWTNYNAANSGILNPNINDMDVDENGCLWLSTYGAGIHQYCCEEHTPFIESEYSLCKGDSLTLDFSNIHTDLKWSTGHIGSSIVIADTGSYWVHSAPQNYCSKTFYFKVRYIDEPILSIQQDTLICSEPPLKISITGDFDNLLWSTNETTSSIEISNSGSYWATASNQCGIYTDSTTITFFTETLTNIPSVVTPNNDGINDVFSIPRQYEYSFYRVRIYDLNGALMFESFDINDVWDGTFNGALAPQGVYVYELFILCNGEPIVKTGSVLLLLNSTY